MKTVLAEQSTQLREFHEYRSLRVWQRAMELSRRVIMIFEDQLITPVSLKDKIFKTAYAIPAMIATGYSRGSQAELIRCMNLSRGNLAALDTYCMLSHQIGELNLEQRRQIEVLIIETSRLIEQSCDTLESLL